MHTSDGKPRLRLFKADASNDDARMSRFLEVLPARMDQLVEAALQEDWSEVRRLSGLLTRMSRDFGYRTLGDCAQRVRSEADKPENQLGIKRSIVQLISSCGKSRTAADRVRAVS